MADELTTTNTASTVTQDTLGGGTDIVGIVTG